MIGYAEQTTFVRCPVCASSGAKQWPLTGDSRKISCPHCGQFQIVGIAVKVLEKHPTLREEASRLINAMPRPANGWLPVSAYTLAELFPAVLGLTGESGK